MKNNLKYAKLLLSITKEERKLKKVENGITLISLVVTIIVLLIITSVALAGLDEDGVVSEAFNETEYQQEVINGEQNKMDRVRNEQLKDWGF